MATEVFNEDNEFIEQLTTVELLAWSKLQTVSGCDNTQNLVPHMV